MGEDVRIVVATGEEGGIEDRVSDFEESKTFTLLNVKSGEEYKEDKVIHPNYSNAPEGMTLKKALLVVKESPDIVIAESYSANVLTTFNLAGIDAKSCRAKSVRVALKKYFREGLSSPIRKPKSEELEDRGLRTDTSGGLIQRVLNVMGAKLNKLLDRLEEPEEQLAYMEKKLQERRKKIDLAIRDVIADRNLLRRKLEEKEKDSQERGLLKAKLQQTNQRLKVLKKKRKELIEKMERIRPKMEELTSEWKATKAESRIAEALYGMKGEFGDLDSALDRIEEKIRKKKALADASADMLEANYPNGKVIEIEGDDSDSSNESESE